MAHFLLDTDHLTLFHHAHSPLLQRMTRQHPFSVAISPISVEETIRGRLAILARQLQGSFHTLAYQRLLASISLLNSFPIVAFDAASESLFQQLRSSVRIGSLDLKIAAIALTHSLTVLTRNTKDFARVPGLQLDDWTK